MFIMNNTTKHLHVQPHNYLMIVITRTLFPLAQSYLKIFVTCIS